MSYTDGDLDRLRDRAVAAQLRNEAAALCYRHGLGDAQSTTATKRVLAEWHRYGLDLATLDVEGATFVRALLTELRTIVPREHERAQDLRNQAAEIVVEHNLQRTDIEHAARSVPRRAGARVGEWTVSEVTTFVTTLRQIAERKAN